MRAYNTQTTNAWYVICNTLKTMFFMCYARKLLHMLRSNNMLPRTMLYMLLSNNVICAIYGEYYLCYTLTSATRTMLHVLHTNVTFATLEQCYMRCSVTMLHVLHTNNVNCVTYEQYSMCCTRTMFHVVYTSNIICATLKQCCICYIRTLLHTLHKKSIKCAT